MKKWFLGILLAVASLLCSTAYAVEPAMSEPIVSFDVVATADVNHVDSGLSVVVIKRRLNDAGEDSSAVIVTASASSSDYGAGSNTVPCMATCRNKVTDNVSSSADLHFEVGWRS